jgi:hypothetical protein
MEMEGAGEVEKRLVEDACMSQTVTNHQSGEHRHNLNTVVVYRTYRNN